MFVLPYFKLSFMPLNCMIEHFLFKKNLNYACVSKHQKLFQFINLKSQLLEICLKTDQILYYTNNIV